MARQPTRLWIVAVDTPKKKQYVRCIKKISKNITDFEVIIRTTSDPRKVKNVDILILLLEAESFALSVIEKLLSELNKRTICLIDTQINDNEFLKKIVQVPNQVFLFPSTWLENGLCEVILQRIVQDWRTQLIIDESIRANDSLLKNLPGMAYRCINDISWTMKYVSMGCRELTGYSPEDLIDNRTIAYNTLIYVNDREMVNGEIQNAIEKNKQYQIVYRIKTTEGTPKWVWEKGNAFRSLDTGDYFLEGFITDITDRVMAQRELIESQVKLKNIYNTVAIGLGSTKNGVFHEVNDYFCDLLQFTRSDLIGRKASSLFLLKDTEHPISDIFLGEAEVSTHAKLRRKDGELLDILLTASRIEETVGSEMVSFAVLDLTKQTQLKNLLDESEAKSRSIMDHMHEGVILTSEMGVVIEFSDIAAQMIDLKKQEALGQSLIKLIDRIEKEQIVKLSNQNWKAFFNEVLASRDAERINKEWEGEIRNPSGEYRFCHIEFFTIATPNGNRLAIIVRDINDSKRHERELQFLMDISNAIRKSPNDIIAIRKAVLDTLTNLLGFHSITLASFEDNRDMGSIVELRGITPDKLGKKVSWQNCVQQQTLFEESVYSICDECMKQIFDEGIDPAVFKTRISIPLIFGNHKIAIIFLIHQDEFTDYEFRLLKAVSNIVANAMNQAILFQRTEQRLKRLESLHVIDQSISGLFNLDLTNRIILDQAKEQLEADAGDILILNTATNMMEYSASFGLMQVNIDEQRVHLSHSMAGQVLMSRDPCIVPDIEKEEIPFIMDHLHRCGFHSYFAYPLVAKGEPKGVIEIYFQNPYQPDTEWINFLHSLATQAGIAIDNIQLFEKMKRLRYD